MAQSKFLTAEWRKLVMINYVVDAALLKKYIPHKTELDLWSDKCYVSLVGFMFLNTKLKGIKIPFHSNFAEVNLRFYVRYKDQNEWKRGVVFIKEIAPKPALTFIANTIYGEHYETLPLKHKWEHHHNKLVVEYSWLKNTWHKFRIEAEVDAVEIKSGSEEEFVTEHYWGYTKMDEKTTSEYQVEHPRWKVYPVSSHTIDVDFELIYGTEFAHLKNENPTSSLLAEGSQIIVRSGRKIS